MPQSSKAFLLLLLVVMAAGALALFVHDWNERIITPFPSETTTSPSTNAPALVVISAPTSTPSVVSASAETFVSADHVTTVTLDFDRSLVLPNPFSFHGTTTAFENQAAWMLTQGDGKELASGNYYVYSTDSGHPGPFSVTASTTKPATISTGTLMIYEASAKDGEPIHRVTIPVRLLP